MKGVTKVMPRRPVDKMGMGMALVRQASECLLIYVINLSYTCNDVTMSREAVLLEIILVSPAAFFARNFI